MYQNNYTNPGFTPAQFTSNNGQQAYNPALSANATDYLNLNNYANQLQQQNQQRNQPPEYLSRNVNSIDEAKNILLDNTFSTYIFVDKMQQKLYVRKGNPDGTSNFGSYKLEAVVNPNQSTADTFAPQQNTVNDEVNAQILDMQNKIKELEQTVVKLQLNTKINNMSANNTPKNNTNNNTNNR